MSKHLFLVAASLVSCLALGSAAEAQDCSGAPVYFSGEIVEIESAMTVKAGKGCFFNISGIPGALTETVISQKPKVGRAGVEGLKPYYLAKPGYQGADEFAYTFIGQGQYGGPMKVTIRRKITVVP
ncbi:hypothetical protein [Microvirga terrestris]|uniref:DUF992 domain-containing protein n=1 Tax=Microvirga terrestris TaxID=2791024 RepID=A0ABS0HRA0_9HYPH|nr:hypothetical protein [Microvirga terrestris]MBF9196009.1 hypothetical protein [Microvirga terrestris]